MLKSLVRLVVIGVFWTAVLPTAFAGVSVGSPVGNVTDGGAWLEVYYTTSGGVIYWEGEVDMEAPLSLPPNTTYVDGILVDAKLWWEGEDGSTCEQGTFAFDDSVSGSAVWYHWTVE